jgi:hypothetical protein
MRRRPQLSTQIQAHIPAPVGGLNTVDAGYEMPATDAPVLFNVIAAENGLRSRLGYKEFATNVGSGMVPTVMPYAGSSWDGTKDRLFATTSTTLYDVTAGGSSPTSKLTFSSSSGDAGWGNSHAVVNSAGAHFLMYFDEKNGYHVYTESTDTWAAVAAGAGATQINGVTPGNLVFGTVWKNFVLFVERDTSKMWFGSSTNALYGTVTSFDFGAKFLHGGSLVGLWSWTGPDGGDSINDYLVAVSSSGDLVIYSGTDPNSATSFGIRGVWFIGGVPAGRRIATRDGGDLLIVTNLGVLSLSKLVSGVSVGDRSQYETRKIGNTFNQAVATSGAYKGWALQVHPEDATLVVTVPTGAAVASGQYAMSLHTRGWCEYRYLPIVSMGAWLRQLYFGTADGRVCINTGYLDNVNLAATTYSEIQCGGVSAFTNLGDGRSKQLQRIAISYLNNGGADARAEARYRFNLSEVSAFVTSISNASNLWGVGLWGVAKWGGGYTTTRKQFGAAGMGPDFAVAWRMNVTARTAVLGFDVECTTGAEMTL